MQNPLEMASQGGFRKLNKVNGLMQYILHDFRVACWAIRTNHRDHKDFRIAVRWPITIRRATPTYLRGWLVCVRWPQVCFLNADTVELDYVLSRSTVDS